MIFKAIYALLGTGMLVGGGASVLVMFGIVPENELPSGSLHIMVEFGCALVALGLIAWWYVFHQEAGSLIHWIFVLYLVLLAGVHWAEYFQGNREIVSPLLNSVPAAGLWLAGLISKRN